MYLRRWLDSDWKCMAWHENAELQNSSWRNAEN